MAKRSRNAFLGARRWQDCALMRSWPDWQWQYTRAVRSGGLAVARFRRGAFPGGNPWQFLRSMYPKGGLGRENRQFVARFARHASEMSWLWQDMRAMHPKCPANRRRRIHRAKILPGRGTFRCAGPSNHARRANLAIQRRRSALAPATPAPPNSAEQREPPTTTPPPSWQRTTHSIRGASGSHTANAPTPHRPATLRRQADVKSCAARAPQRQSATRGPTTPQCPMAPPGRSIHNGGGATRIDANLDATGATAPTPSAASGARSAKPPAHPTRKSAAAFGGTSLRSVEGAHPPYIFIRRSCGGVCQLMLQEQLRFPATQANVEARRALAMAYRTETACHQHLVNAESTAILEHDNARLKAAIPPEPRQHVHRFAVHAPHFAIFRPVVHVCILEQVFV